MKHLLWILLLVGQLTWTTHAQAAAAPGKVKLDDLNDARIIRKIDESGFIDRAYAAQGVSLKSSVRQGFFRKQGLTESPAKKE